MKISAKTLNAAKRAAKARGMTLDKWADQALAEAAAAADHPSNIEAGLREISEKIDRLADRQSLGEKANEQLAGAVQELGASYQRARESAGQMMTDAETKASSAAEELASKARELLARASRSANELVGSFKSMTDGAEETTESKPSKGPSRSGAGRRSAKATASRRSAAGRKTQGEKPRGSQRRRSKPKSET